MKTFDCPSCGEPVEAKADYIARGMKCPVCNTGFIPVKVELKRKIGANKPPASSTGLLLLIVGVVVLAVSWSTSRLTGMVGGGFLAVIGSVFVLIANLKKKQT